MVPPYYEFEVGSNGKYRWRRAMKQVGNAVQYDISKEFDTKSQAAVKAWEHHQIHFIDKVKNVTTWKPIQLVKILGFWFINN